MVAERERVVGTNGEADEEREGEEDVVVLWDLLKVRMFE